MSMKSGRSIRLLCFCVLFLAGTGYGCQPAAVPVPTGTPGLILAGTHPLKDVQVTIYPAESSNSGPLNPMAFGISDDGGRFRLHSNGSLEGFELPEGTYRMTLESVGEFQLVWPADFADPRKTPLKKSWTPADSELILDVPEPRIVL